MVDKNKNVVVVDDDPAVGRAIARLVRAAGFIPHIFASGEAFLRSSALPACFIIDIQLPGMSGFDLAQRIRDEGGREPIIFVTAHDEVCARKRGKDLGAIGFFSKPFESDSLLALLAGAMP